MPKEKAISNNISKKADFSLLLKGLLSNSTILSLALLIGSGVLIRFIFKNYVTLPHKDICFWWVISLVTIVGLFVGFVAYKSIGHIGPTQTQFMRDDQRFAGTNVSIGAKDIIDFFSLKRELPAPRGRVKGDVKGNHSIDELSKDEQTQWLEKKNKRKKDMSE
ncbi:MAG: hypothetical protein A2Z72_01335 [Omnitrophica bacterium RBG_13_46_9]|nr:MAG: hypothetical protein A2Z72_01335 [Omnitrophica bacterium RBG_13_46_9]